MNNDTIFTIQEFIADFDFLYNISLVDTRFCVKNRRKKIIEKNNSLHLLKTFVNFSDDYDNGLETEIDYLNEFMDFSTVSETLQWYANILLNYIPFYKYENITRGYIYISYKHVISNGIYGKVYIKNHFIYLHNVYRCRYVHYKRFEHNLTVKALIY